MDDLDLDQLRALLAAELPRHAAFDGWNVTALGVAADMLGIARPVAELAFPGGAVDMIDAWFAHVDDAMLVELPPETLAAMKVRTRITALVQARLDVVAAHGEALRRALAVLALPSNLARATRLNWRAADAMWHAAGDTATDYNHYTKRLLLGGVYAATVLAMLADDSEGRVETRGFLDRRIEGIMRFERVKSQLLGGPGQPEIERLSLTRFIGRLRYPAT